MPRSRASFARHVLTSNPSCTFDVFAHSWSPELGALIDELVAEVGKLYGALYGSIGGGGVEGGEEEACG